MNKRSNLIKRVKSGVISLGVAMTMLTLAYSRELSTITSVVMYAVALIVLGLSIFIISSLAYSFLENKQKQERKRVKESRGYKFKNAI